jgi:competence protein ComGF
MIVFKRVNSFTVVELIVTMIIGSVVVSAIYYTLSVTQKTLSKSYQITNTVSDYLSLNKALQYDFEEAQFVEKTSENELYFSYDERPSVIYSFSDSHTVRRVESVIDSFSTAIQEIQFDHLNHNTNFIKAMIIHLRYNQNRFNFVYNKIYTAKDLLQTQDVFDE